MVDYDYVWSDRGLVVVTYSSVIYRHRKVLRSIIEYDYVWVKRGKVALSPGDVGFREVEWW